MNKHIVIGGTSGIGLAIANKLSSKNNLVYIAGRRKIDDISIYMDVLDEGLIKAVFEKMDSLNSIIYSTGVVSSHHSIKDFKNKKWHHMIDVNVTGAILCCKYAFELLKKSKGNVVFISSIAGRFYSKMASFEYTASKAALIGLGKQLAMDWAKYNILVNIICPSQTKTPMLKNNTNINIPLNRIAEPEEIATLTEFLVKKNTYMTGCCFDINGGQFFT
jgi:NAD(P)-dependent dehydrogenase (short-subunit alcohol dehydrogenase family)